MKKFLCVALALYCFSLLGCGGGGSVSTPPPSPQPPVITSVLTASGTVGSPFAYTIMATNSPTSFDATGLPAPLVVDKATGKISGTPSVAGTSNVTISATNAAGTGSATLVLTVNSALQPPVITSVLTASGTVGSPFAYTIMATNSPTSFDATGLPAPLVVDKATGKISGTPSVAGTSNVTISATNAAGTGSATLVLTVNSALQPPVITSVLTASGTVGSPFAYTIMATNSPTSFDATGLPAPLVVDKATGKISGTPSVAGTSNVTISATNAAGTGSATLVLTVNSALQPPVITSVLTASGTVGSPFAYTIMATNSPTSFDATGLPAPLVVDKATGKISGTPSVAGTSNVTISATNAAGTGSATLVLTVNSALQPPVITSVLTASGTVGSPFAYTIMATNSPTSFDATGLPAPLVVDKATGKISGTPSVAGTSNVTISATNAAGTGSATLVLTVTANSNTWSKFYAPSGKTDQGFRMVVSGTKVFVSHSPSIDSTERTAGILEYDTSGNLLGNWDNGAVPSAINALTTDANMLYACGTTGGDSNNVAAHAAWLLAFPYSAPFPPAVHSFQLNGKRTEAFGCVFSQGKIFMLVRTDDLICGKVNPNVCAYDRVVVLDTNGNQLYSFPAGNIPDNDQHGGIGDGITRATGIAVSADGSSVIVAGDGFLADGTPGNHGFGAFYLEKFDPQGNYIGPFLGSPGVGAIPTFDKNGVLYDVESEFSSIDYPNPPPTNEEICVDHLDPNTFAQVGAGCWDGMTNWPSDSGSFNVALGVVINPQGGVVALGTCGGVGCSWSVDTNGKTLSRKFYTSLQGGTVSSWSGGYLDSAGNIFLVGTGSDGTSPSQVVFAKNP